MLVDSHCHLDQLDLSAYNGDLSAAITQAHEAGVGHFLCVCITLAAFPQIVSIVETYAHISASVGLHPNEPVTQEPTTEELIALGQHPSVVAVGETGLDYFRSEGDLHWQRERFRTHIRAAIALKQPLIVHSREAQDDTIRILQEENAQIVGGVLHCFTGDWAMAQAAMDLNFYISFSGIVTFNSAKDLQAVAKKIPLWHLLIETDSPYLAPVPYRGKPNEPAYVREVAAFLADLRGIDFTEFAQKTTENFYRLFKCAVK